MVQLEVTDPAWSNYCWALGWTKFCAGIRTGSVDQTQAEYNYELAKFNGRCDIVSENDYWLITFATEADKFMFQLKWAEKVDVYQK